MTSDLFSAMFEWSWFPKTTHMLVTSRDTWRNYWWTYQNSPTDPFSPTFSFIKNVKFQWFFYKFQKNMTFLMGGNQHMFSPIGGNQKPTNSSTSFPPSSAIATRGFFPFKWGPCDFASFFPSFWALQVARSSSSLASKESHWMERVVGVSETVNLELVPWKGREISDFLG